MNCTHSTEELILFQAGELGPDQEAELRDRLSSCPDCREELVRLQAVAGAWTPPDFDRDALDAARARAYARIGGSWRARRHRAMAGLDALLAPLRPLPQLALAAVLVAVGFALGTWRSGDPAPDPVTADVVLDIRDVLIDPETGVAEVRYDRMESAALRGDLQNDALVEILQAALSGPADDRVRLHALKAVSSLAAEGGPDARLAEAVITVIRGEEQDALRLRAIRALDALYEGRTLPDPARTVLLDVLVSGANDGVRVAALDALMAHRPEARDAGRLLHLSTSDPNPYIRLSATRALEELESGPLEEIR